MWLPRWTSAEAVQGCVKAFRNLQRIEMDSLNVARVYASRAANETRLRAVPSYEKLNYKP
jgi:transposase